MAALMAEGGRWRNGTEFRRMKFFIGLGSSELIALAARVLLRAGLQG